MSFGGNYRVKAVYTLIKLSKIHLFFYSELHYFKIYRLKTATKIRINACKICVYTSETLIGFNFTFVAAVKLNNSRLCIRKLRTAF